MFTAISVATVDPVAVVFYRLALGAVVLSLVVYARGEVIPLEGRTWAGFLVMAIAGNALPFFLISWGQQSVNSGVAGMIMAIMPLLTMVFAHYFVPGDKIMCEHHRYYRGHPVARAGFRRGRTRILERPGHFYRGKLLRSQLNPDQALAAVQPDGRRLRGINHGEPDHVSFLADRRSRKQ